MAANFSITYVACYRRVGLEEAIRLLLDHGEAGSSQSPQGPLAAKRANLFRDLELVR